MGKPKYNKFFPEKVYRCTCLRRIIASCLADEIYCLTDICEKVDETVRKKIFCVKCGENEQNVIFSCCNHMPVIIVETDETKSYCRTCIRRYLQRKYYHFDHVNFKLNHKKINSRTKNNKGK